MKYKTDFAAAACSVVFIAVLAVATYWDPTIRVLHGFESLPYFAAAALCLRHNKFGYALGVVSGAFWLWMAGFLTNFVRNGFERLPMLIRTGTVERFDILIAVPAAIAAGGLILFSFVGYFRLTKSPSDIFLFLGALVIVPTFFIVIFAAFAPQYLGIFHGLLKR